jgi:hypothetical protein
LKSLSSDADAALLRIDQDVLLPARHTSVDRGW